MEIDNCLLTPRAGLHLRHCRLCRQIHRAYDVERAHENGCKIL